MHQRVPSTGVPWRQLAAAQGVPLLIVPGEPKVRARLDMANEAICILVHIRSEKEYLF